MIIKPFQSPLGPALELSLPRVTGTADVAQAGSDFGAMLANVASDAAATMKSAESASIQGIKGTMPVQDVVNHMMAAERTLQTVVTVRDKVVSAYQEMTRMAI